MVKQWMIISATSLVLATAAACADSTSPGKSGSATIAGTVREVGGPPPGLDIGIVADITVSGDGSYNLKSATDGTFKISVPPGTYRITAALGNGFPCDSQQVITKDNATSSVTVTCSVK
jgi:hypothetical protein